MSFFISRKGYNMSSFINGTSITLTRGDTLRVKINMNITENGQLQPYTPSAGDSVRFALKHPTLNSKKTDYKDTEPLILKDIPVNTMILELEPSDTKTLEAGKYVYDIQITFANGRVDTFITEAEFKITKEVY